MSASTNRFPGTDKDSTTFYPIIFGVCIEIWLNALCLSNSCIHGESDSFCQSNFVLFLVFLLQRWRHQSVVETPSEQVHGEEQEQARPPRIHHGAKTVNARPQAVARQHCPYHSRKWSRTAH